METNLFEEIPVDGDNQEVRVEEVHPEAMLVLMGEAEHNRDLRMETNRVEGRAKIGSMDEKHEIGGLRSTSGENLLVLIVTGIGCSAKKDISPGHEQRVIPLELGVVNSMEGRAVDEITERAGEEPLGQWLEVDMPSLIHEIEPEVIQSESEERLVAHQVGCDGRDGEKDGVGNTLRNLEAQRSGRKGVDRLVMVGMEILVEPFDMKKTMEPVVDEFDCSCMPEQMQHQSVQVEHGQIIEQAEVIAAEHCDSVVDITEFPHGFPLQLHIIHRGPPCDLQGFGIIGPAQEQKEFKDYHSE